MTRKRHFYRRISALLLALALLAGLAGAVEPAPAETVTLGIYTTADLRGRYAAKDPLDGSAQTAGFLKVATAMKAERAAVDADLLIDAGDALAGGELAGTALKAGYGDAAPVALALRQIGYDALVPGEREFRLSGEARDAFFSALSAGAEGAESPVRVLSANYLSESRQAPLLTPYQVFSAAAGDHTFKIGVLGLSPINLEEAVPERSYTGASFSHKDNKEGTYAWEWTRYYQKQLLETEACDLVVVVLHDGADAARAFISHTTGIDLVVAGHGGGDAFTAPNADGAQVSCVSAGGAGLTRTPVTLGADGALSVGVSTVIPLSEYEDDEDLARRLAAYGSEAESAAKAGLATLSGNWENASDTRYHQSNETDLVGRAMSWAAGADLALVTPSLLGDVRLTQLAGKDGALSLRDCHALYPQPDSTLYAVKLTAGQIKAWLEACAGRYQVDGETAALSGGGDADVLYGLDYEVYLGNPAGSRVVNLTWQGKAVEDDKVFTVAVDGSRLAATADDDPYGWYEATGVGLDSDKVVWSGLTSRSFGGVGGSIPFVLAAYLRETTAQHGFVSPLRESRWYLYPGSLGGPITRLEFVTMLYELAGSPTPGADAAFIDVTGNNAVVWAAEAGVVSGNGRGKFLPAQAVTREQAAVMLASYATGQGVAAPEGAASPAAALLDYGQVASWARPSVDFCWRTGILPGVGLDSSLFLPAQALTREEAREILNRVDALVQAH